MKLPFLNRQSELALLNSFIASKEPSLAVLYGRRRCGKSRLLQHLDPADTVYYLADQSDQSLQRQMLSLQLERLLPGFSEATYHTWEALFKSMNLRLKTSGRKKTTVILDEFPYLATEYPALPGLIQNMIDTGELQSHIVLCGSSQRMMKGIVFSETAPLYGRAREIIKIRPLKPGWIIDAMGVHDEAAIESYAIWGGVPRYWELAAEFPEIEKAITSLVLNRDGILHNEPRRLLLDDMRTDIQPHSLLAIIGSGANRISEIGARLEKSAMSILRPLEILTDLGLVRREVPFGEQAKNSKKSLYSIADPFLRFWYRYVYPNLSALEQELYHQILLLWRKTKNQFIGGVWEDLARESVPFLPIDEKQWKQAYRWWGKTITGETTEIDIVAESLDGKTILLGEAKWGDADPEALCRTLDKIATALPFAEGKSIVTACWIGHPKSSVPGVNTFSSKQVLEKLR